MNMYIENGNTSYLGKYKWLIAILHVCDDIVYNGAVLDMQFPLLHLFEKNILL